MKWAFDDMPYGTFEQYRASIQAAIHIDQQHDQLFRVDKAMTKPIPAPRKQKPAAAFWIWTTTLVARKK